MFRKTDEQLAIESASDDDQPMKVTAYAGSGKTKMCELVGLRHSGKVGLYAAFGKAAQLDAERRMPKNIICRTFNSLAWEGMKVSDVWGFTGVGDSIKMRPKDLLRTLRLDDEVGISVVKMTLRRFMQSLDETVSSRHVPREALARFENVVEQRQFREEIVRAARTLWYRMIDPKDREVPLPHDGYLKLWYHQGGELPFEPAIVFLDEGQDMNPINWGLAQRWPGQHFVVGDSYQQIYAFRGAIDALKRVNYPTFYLTKSFRFGEAIAAIANDLLMLDGEQKPPLVGSADIDSKIIDPPYRRIDEPHTVLCRTNMGLMEEALELVKAGRSVAIVGYIDEAIKQLESAWALYCGEDRKVKHPSIKLLGDWDGLVEAAKDDHELSLTVRRVEKYKAKIPSIAHQLRHSVAKDEDDADVVLSTCHKAKGREWPIVRLADDFPELIRQDEETGQWKLREDERNLLYVAATRAVNVLYGNTSLLTAKACRQIKLAA